MNKSKALNIKLPSYVLKDCWQGFVDMRYSIKKPLTERSCMLIFKKLKSIDESLANEILDQSTMNCWQGIFPLADDQERKDW